MDDNTDRRRRTIKYNAVDVVVVDTVVVDAVVVDAAVVDAAVVDVVVAGCVFKLTYELKKRRLCVQFRLVRSNAQFTI